MEIKDLDSLIHEIGELRRAVRKANPFIREFVAIRSYALLSLPLGVLVLVLCVATEFLRKAYGSFGAIPAEWKTAAWVAFGLVMAIGSVSKWIIIGRRAAKVEKSATFLSVMRAWYGGSWFSLTLPAALCMVAISFFVASSGHPWLVASVVAIFLGYLCNVVAIMLGRREYLATGWYSLGSGLASLFFIESSPMVWIALVWAGIFIVFGVAGLIGFKKEV